MGISSIKAHVMAGLLIVSTSYGAAALSFPAGGPQEPTVAAAGHLLPISAQKDNGLQTADPFHGKPALVRLGGRNHLFDGDYLCSFEARPALLQSRLRYGD